MTSSGISHLFILARPAFRTRWQDPGNFYLYKAMHSQATVSEWTISGFLRALLNPKIIFHIHWPDNILRNRQVVTTCVRVFLFMLLTIIISVKGRPLIWTAHNLQSHERYHPRLERLFWWWFLRKLDAIIFHSKSLRRQFVLKYPYAHGLPSRIIPLSMFHNMYPRKPRYNIRKNLSIPKAAKLCLFLGQIREYKNLPCLVACFRQLPPYYHLVIAGKCEDRFLLENIKTLIDKDERIHLFPHFINNQNVSSFFSAADLAVLPFSSVSNSGSALLALSFSVPVLIPKIPQFKELQKEFGSKWVYLFKSFTPSCIMRATKSRSRTRIKVPPSREIQYAAARTLAFFSSLNKAF